MLTERIREKLQILATAARYDVSCASSGSKRDNPGGALGNTTGMGICHSYTPDGRCVSLLKILLTNHCIFDCAYCISRRSNDVKRAGFTVQEVVDLTIGFYRRNYIEGLFLSSGIFKDPDTTMERLVRIAETLRTEHKFNGYIHLKAIPGASEELLERAGRAADRLSVNIEIPSELSLKRVAPEKSYAEVMAPMGYLRERIAETKRERAAAKTRRTYLTGGVIGGVIGGGAIGGGADTTDRDFTDDDAPRPGTALGAHDFSPGGQSTQLVIGATPETDTEILTLADGLYREQGLRRVYYSGYVPIPTDARVPALSAPPLLREHRLYQADWLMRQYGFALDEILDPAHGNLDEAVDPKLGWALRHPEAFPIDVNLADERQLLRVPGLGHKSARRIVSARRSGKVRVHDLRRLGVQWNRAKYFVSAPDHATHYLHWDPAVLRRRLVSPQARAAQPAQLALF